MTSEFLPIIINHFETIQGINSPTITIEQKKKNFKEFLLKQFEKEKNVLISKTDFLNNCKKEVQYFKKNVISIIAKEKEIKLLSYTSKIEFDMTIEGFKLLKLKEIEIEKLYGKHTSVNITRFVRTAKKEMCINDIEFIESVFETNDFIDFEDLNLESLKSSKTTAIKKIIFLNELGVIEYLMSCPEFKQTPTWIARYLALITEEKEGTLQPLIRLLLNKDEHNKNYPYYTDSTVKEARQTLINNKIKIKIKTS